MIPLPTRTRSVPRASRLFSASWLLVLCAVFCGTFSSCAILAGRAKKPMRNEVFVLGSLQQMHLTEELYSLDRFRDFIRQLDPDLVLVDIPPDRFEPAWNQFLRQGTVTEERVVLYPEFTEVLFPIALEGRFRIVPCSGWTKRIAERRRALLKQWETTRPADTQVVNEAQAKAQRELESRGLAHDPLLIHSAEYDAIVAQGFEPYEAIFGDDLGTGSWKDLNLAHYELIEEALDAVRGNDLRVLVIFGVQNKYRLRELLGTRDDIHLLRLPQAVR